MTFSTVIDMLCNSRFSCSSNCCGSAYGTHCCTEGEYEPQLWFVVRLFVASIIFSIALILAGSSIILQTILLVLSAAISGSDIYFAAFKSVINKEFFDKTVLITLTVAIALIIGRGAEAAAMVIIFQIAEIIIEFCYHKTFYTIKDALFPQTLFANIIKDNDECEVLAAELNIGDIIVVYPNQIFPCDCIVVEGSSSVDLSNLGSFEKTTPVFEGDEIYSGSLNIGTKLRCEVVSTMEESAAAFITNSVLEASKNEAPAPLPISSVATFLTPVFMILSIIAMPVLHFVMKIEPLESINRALSFLIVANPCAIMVAMPLIKLAGLAWAAKHGVLFSNCISVAESADAGVLIFDREGTLTEGMPKVTSVVSERMGSEVLLKICAHAFAYSSSAQAKSIISSYTGTIYIDLIQNFVEIPNSGVEVTIDGVSICAGNKDLLAAKSIFVPEIDSEYGEIIYIAIGGEYAGHLVLSDALRSDASAAISQLLDLGAEVVMLTSESAEGAYNTATQLGITEYYCKLSDKEKALKVADIRNTCSPSKTVIYVSGRAASISVREEADLSIEYSDLEGISLPKKSDVVIVSDSASSLVSAIKISKFSNLFSYMVAGTALLVKLILLTVATMGAGAIWFSIFLDSSVAIASVLVSVYAYGRDSIDSLSRQQN